MMFDGGGGSPRSSAVRAGGAGVGASPPGEDGALRGAFSGVGTDADGVGAADVDASAAGAPISAAVPVVADGG
jgi:hypothetical protein